jgi:hypothetical protein
MTAPIFMLKEQSRIVLIRLRCKCLTYIVLRLQCRIRSCIVMLWSQFKSLRLRVSTKVLILLSTKLEFQQNYSLISSKFRCFDFPKFRFWFRCWNQNSDFDFDIRILIPILISTSEFRSRNRNSDSDVRISIIKIESLELHLCYEASAPAPAPSKNFDVAPAAPATTLLYTKATLWKKIKVNLWFGATFSSDFCIIKKGYKHESAPLLNNNWRYY